MYYCLKFLTGCATRSYIIFNCKAVQQQNKAAIRAANASINDRNSVSEKGIN